MKIFIPWRVKYYMSEHFPLIYHVVSNIGFKANSEQHWDQRLAETWEDSSRDWPDKNELVKKLTHENNDVLDIACGNGSLLRYLQEQGYKNLHGLEISSYAVKRLSQAGVSMRQERLPYLPYSDGSFDVVIASQILEHIIRRRIFVKEMSRILRSNGRAFIFVPNDCLGPIDEKEHVIKYTKQSLEKFLSKYFKQVRVESIRDRNHGMAILFANVQV